MPTYRIANNLCQEVLLQVSRMYPDGAAAYFNTIQHQVIVLSYDSKRVGIKKMQMLLTRCSKWMMKGLKVAVCGGILEPTDPLKEWKLIDPSKAKDLLKMF